MSMTKRYLESLPEEEQDAILGRRDEWTDDAENEPTEEELAEWARALMEEEDAFTERDEAPLVKPEPKRVDCDGWSI